MDKKGRLTTPLVRTEEGLVPQPWYEAIHLVKDRLAALKAQHGPNAIAGLITARCTNEELYLFQKLMRAAIGTNQVDSSARHGHLTFTRAPPPPAAAGRTRKGTALITQASALPPTGTA